MSSLDSAAAVVVEAGQAVASVAYYGAAVAAVEGVVMAV